MRRDVDNSSMPLIADFIAPTRHTDPAEALAQVQRIYQQQIGHLRQTMQRYVAGDTPEQPVRAFYPFVRVQTSTNARADTKLAYGFVEGPGRYETTLTRPDLFANYYLEQFRLLRRSHGVELEVGTSSQPIPIHFSFAEHDHVEGQLSARAPPADARFVRPARPGTAMDDGIANGTWQPRPGDAQPLSLFTAPRVDYSLHRLRHYTGTPPEWFQNFVLFTNYQFYIDEFVRLGHAEMAKPDSEYIAFIEPGNVVTRRVGLSAEAGDELGARRRACRKCPPTTWCARMRAASPWSTSAWARPMPRPSPTTSPCCARTPG
jgi:AMP nucleosidase